MSLPSSRQHAEKTILPSSLEPGAAGGLLTDDRWVTETEQLMQRLARGGQVDQASQMVQQHLEAGGKRLRARLALAATEALGGDRSRAVGWAAAVELLHNGSLVHDDIQDSDRVRRGKPSLWARYGRAQAINAGDLLLMLPFVALGETRVDDGVRARLVAILAERASLAVRGQVRELELLRERRFDAVSYLDAVKMKSGELLALPVHGAALLAGRDGREARTLADPFIDLGVLHQLQDDVLDLYGAKGRDRPGGDIYDGKVTALVVAHLALYPGESGWLIDLLSRPRQEKSARDVESVRVRFSRKRGALDQVIANIRRIQERVASSQALEREPALRGVAAELVELATASIRGVMEQRGGPDRSRPLRRSGVTRVETAAVEGKQRLWPGNR